MVIGGGWYGAPYVADPASVPRPWLYVVAVVAAVVFFAAVSTLTLLGYCLVVVRHATAATTFLTRVGNYSAIGAIAGTLLGLRVAAPQLADSPQEPTFVELVGVVGNTATLLTLVMIAACWPSLLGLVRATKDAAMERLAATHPLFRWATNPKINRWFVPVAVLSSNSAGVTAGFAAWHVMV